MINVNRPIKTRKEFLINTRNITQTLALTQTLTQTLTLTLTQTLTLTLTLYDQNHMLIIKHTNFIDFWIGVP
jgi:hypothetical protein